MKKTKCEECRKEFALNDTFQVENRILCQNCSEKVLAAEKSEEFGIFQRQVDPTVCAHCGLDNGSSALPSVAGLPTCEMCEKRMRSWPFPAWIKVSFLILMIVILSSLLWNGRFIQGYLDMKRYQAAMENRQLKEATRWVQQASLHVPEDEIIGALVSYTEGITLFSEEQLEAAVSKFRQCVNKLPPQYGVAVLLLQAEAGIAFKSKDYDKYLEISKQYVSETNNNPFALGYLASAYACKFAVEGKEEFKEKAMQNLEKARELIGDDNLFRESEQRILHRIETREIISRAEFQNKFPNGWNPKKKD